MRCQSQGLAEAAWTRTNTSPSYSTGLAISVLNASTSPAIGLCQRRSRRLYGEVDNAVRFL